MINKIVEDKRLLIIYIIVIALLVFGITYASMPELTSNYLVTNILRVDEDAYGETVFDSSELVFTPILDSNVSKDSNNVIYIDFFVGGSQLNSIDNIIYDIALVDLEIDCELLSPYLKWALVKNGELVSGGSFDYRFDTIKNGRLVLTPIQQDLVKYSEDKSTYDYYEFYVWISDSFQGSDLNQYSDEIEQNNLIGKTLKGKIEVELYGDTKRLLVRNPSDELDTNTCVVSEDISN